MRHGSVAIMLYFPMATRLELGLCTACPPRFSFSLPYRMAGLAPLPIGALRSDFTNIPAGTRLTVGSILYKKLDLPEEEPSTALGTGEQRPTSAVSKPAAVANGDEESGRRKELKGGTRANGGETRPDPAQDSFTRMDIRVGRITKVQSRALLERHGLGGTVIALRDG